MRAIVCCDARPGSRRPPGVCVGQADKAVASWCRAAPKPQGQAASFLVFDVPCDIRPSGQPRPPYRWLMRSTVRRIVHRPTRIGHWAFRQQSNGKRSLPRQRSTPTKTKTQLQRVRPTWTPSRWIPANADACLEQRNRGRWWQPAKVSLVEPEQLQRYAIESPERDLGTTWPRATAIAYTTRPMRGNKNPSGIL